MSVTYECVPPSTAAADASSASPPVHSLDPTSADRATAILSNPEEATMKHAYRDALAQAFRDPSKALATIHEALANYPREPSFHFHAAITTLAMHSSLGVITSDHLEASLHHAQAALALNSLDPGYVCCLRVPRT